ncbi:hypothetical protein BJ742DRAFT_741276 [Cladochytrium replicatum]|nr:hypothetical protein BJ742DRAFT_741276 [Cladochytrium replicatum]
MHELHPDSALNTVTNATRLVNSSRPQIRTGIYAARVTFKIHVRRTTRYHYVSLAFGPAFTNAKGLNIASWVNSINCNTTFDRLRFFVSEGNNNVNWRDAGEKGEISSSAPSDDLAKSFVLNVDLRWLYKCLGFSNDFAKLAPLFGQFVAAAPDWVTMSAINKNGVYAIKEFVE